MEARLPSRESSNDITLPHIATAAALALVFLFCIARTVTSVWGRSAESNGLPAARRSAPRAPTALGPPLKNLAGERLPVDGPALESPSQYVIVRTDGDNPGAIIVASRCEPDMAAGKAARYRPRVVAPPTRASRLVVTAPMPTPIPAASPWVDMAQAPPPPAATAVVLRGRIMRPGVNGPVPLPNHPIGVYCLLDAQMMEGRTDAQGFYAFEGLQPGAMYYVIATFVDDLRLGLGQGGVGGARGWRNASTAPPDMAAELSWHQAIEAPTQPGVYALDLGPDNADPEYCPDLRPTHDPVTRSLFRSWRRAALQPF